MPHTEKVTNQRKEFDWVIFQCKIEQTIEKVTTKVFIKNFI